MSTLASYVKEWFQSDQFREPGGLSEVCVSDTDREGLCTCERCGLDPRSETSPVLAGDMVGALRPGGPHHVAGDRVRGTGHGEDECLTDKWRFE